MSGLLDFRDVRRTFPVGRGLRRKGEVHAVDGVSLSVGAGETLGLVGESGCGKSTLGRMAVRLLAPSSGDILFRGEVLPPLGRTAARDDPLRGRLQMIFQDPFSSLNPRLRVGDSVAEPLLGAADQKKRVQDILEQVGINPDDARRYPHEFSGGQRQRLAIARALITKPDLVVCDEAVSALDASVRAQVLHLLKDAQEASGLSYLFISHDLGVVGFMSDVVAVMYLGRIVEQARCADLFRSAAHPYTKALLEAAPRLHLGDSGQSRPQPRLIQGELPNPLQPPAGCAFHPRCPQASDICREQSPDPLEIAPAHVVRCHLYASSPARKEDEGESS